ncbi:MAG: LysR family transcriptional regulator, partial [Oscillospiraceae bacterium]|nr:LysR family transcriptional regulator [Oscillospiraceae bacterium]
MNEVSIKCFLTLADNLSFTKTAQDMYMTQQAVSKYIARLEEELGFRLFVRTRHYVRLTKAGEAYRDLFHRCSQEFERVTAEISEYYYDLQKHIRLGYLEMLDISTGIGEALKQARQKEEDLRFSGVKLPQHELLAQFQNGELDLIITYREFAPKESGVKSRRILNTPLVLLVSPEDPLNTPDATVAAFKSRPFIKAAAGREPVAETRERAMRQCRELGFYPSEIVVAPNLESAYMNAELG